MSQQLTPLKREELPEFESFFKIVENAIGFVPVTHMVLARRPEIERGFSSLVMATFGPGKVDTGLKQLVALMSSVSAGCQYCQAHTSASAERFGVENAKVAAVYDFETSDLFSDAERAALRLARDAGILPNAATPAHFAELRKHFDEPQIVEIMASISLMGWLNRWNDTVATELEDEAFDYASSTLGGRGWAPGKHRNSA